MLCATVMDDDDVLELWTLRPGPDALTRIRWRRRWALDGQTALVASVVAEDYVLSRWKTEYPLVLPPPPIAS